MSDSRTDLPSPNAPNFNARLRETIQTFLGRQGNPLDRALTLRDMVEIGVLKVKSGFTLRPGSGSVALEPGSGVTDIYEPDLTPPPTPADFTVTPAISHVFIEHAAPLYRQGHGHLRTRVYGKIVSPGDPAPVFADAVEIAQFSGTAYALPSNPATTWRLWIKWETVDGVLSADPAGGINGLDAATGRDVAKLLEVLSGEITENHLYQELATRIDLVDAPETHPGSVAQRLSAEAIARADAILAEATARSEADASLQTQINVLSAAGSGDFSGLLAAVQEEQTARVAGDEAEAAARETLAARVTGTENGLSSQAVQIADRYTKAETDSAVSSATMALTAAYQAADAATLNSALTHTNAAISSEQTARSDADSALSTSITTLAATVNSSNTTLSSAIQTEAEARANADVAVSRSVSTLQASAGTGGLIYNGSFANGSAEGWAGLASVSSTPHGGLPKAYAGIQTTRDINFPNADPSQWMACRPGDEFEVSAWVSAQAASPRYGIGIQYERTNGNTETWTILDTTTAPTTAKFLRGYWTAPSDARRVRFWGQIDTFGTENPWHITDVQLRRTDARTGANTAAIQTEAEVRATQTGELYGKVGVKIDLNGYVTGWAMNNDGSTGDMIVLADKFAIGSPGLDTKFPFIVRTTPTVIDGVEVPVGVYINGAYIQGGSIDGASIKGGTIEGSKLIGVTADKITSGYLYAGVFIASTNYESGYRGWAINGDGTAEFSSVIVRGTVYATNGEFTGTVKAGSTILGGLATSYSSGSGFYAGLDDTTYKWRVGSPGGARIQWDGSHILATNADGSRLLDLGATGTSSVLKIGAALDIKANGAATFSGALSAATGSFSGELSGATGSFSGELSAATGTFGGSLTADAVNAVDTINLAGQAVTVSNQATGTAQSASTTLTIPARTTMAITAVGSIGSFISEDSAITNWSVPLISISIDGVGISDAHQYQISAQGETWTDYAIYAKSLSYGRSITNSSASPITVTITVTGASESVGASKSITAFGFKR